MTTAEEQLVSEMIKLNQRLGRLIELFEELIAMNTQEFKRKRGF